MYEHFVKKFQVKLKFLEIDSTDLYEILTQYDYGYGLPLLNFRPNWLRNAAINSRAVKKCHKKLNKIFFMKKFKLLRIFAPRSDADTPSCKISAKSVRPISQNYKAKKKKKIKGEVLIISITRDCLNRSLWNFNTSLLLLMCPLC